MPKKELKEKEIKEELKQERYWEAVGRRKTARARVRLFETGSSFVVNGKPHEEYFFTRELQHIATSVLKAITPSRSFRISAKIEGGGIHSQAEALRHGIARALVNHKLELRKTLKKAGYLKRDPRAKERRKFGLKKARKAPQWSKR